MKNKLLFILTLFILFSCKGHSNSMALQLWYEQPAQNWNEALPVGNGFMGAMIYGDITREHIQINEETLYSGEPSVRIESVELSPYYEEIVRLLKQNEYAEAQKIMERSLQGRLPQSYIPMCDLYLNFEDHPKEVNNYTRSLDLENAVHKVSYQIEGITYTRETFISNPDRVLIYRYSSDQPVTLSFLIEYESQHPEVIISPLSNKQYSIRGQAPGYCDRRSKQQWIEDSLVYLHPEYFDEKGNILYDKPLLYGEEIQNKGMYFESRVHVLKGNTEVEKGKLKVSGEKEIIVLVTAETSYNGVMKSPSTEGKEYQKINDERLSEASNYTYKELLERHIKDYQSLFKKVSFSLDSDKEYHHIPTDKRIINFHQNKDNSLITLLYQYGRYLLISSSRPGGQPANLQGIWNDKIVPPWNCGYTMNINLQMNYWPAELTGLSACTEPLFKLIQELSVTGKNVAEKMYHLPGWTCHHNTSIWREAYPTDGDPSWAFWNLAPGWLCRHLWEHYLFTHDRSFLKDTAYPLMRGAAEFYNGWLIQNEEGHWITPIGTSPENIFITPTGEKVSVSMGPTMDIAIIRELFTNTIQTSELLNIDEEFRKELINKKENLLPYKIGGKGQIQEWMYDFLEAEPDHRHLSHLYGLYPGEQLTYSTAPELMEAARQTLLLRGDEATGWSMGWKINLWARMKDGDHAYKIIKNLFTPIDFGEKQHTGGGLYRNMLDAHPPFQIDGNFGFTAGVTEMLLQSHEGIINILPALPQVWREGAIKGIHARGRFIVDFAWKDYRVTSLTVTSLAGNICRIAVNGENKEFTTQKGEKYEVIK